jgi:hypothetical protein
LHNHQLTIVLPQVTVTSVGNEPSISPGGMCRKNFSLRRSNFPSTVAAGRSMIQEGMNKFQADQMITLGMTHPFRFCLDPAGSSGARRRSRRRGARNFEQDLRGEPQGATHGNQSSAGGNVPGGGKLEKLFTFLVTAADKYRDRKWQACPSTSFRVGLSWTQMDLSDTGLGV